jgi:xylulose-5-phosphate/fructose-6-phosphate phosphoketolase
VDGGRFSDAVRNFDGGFSQNSQDGNLHVRVTREKGNISTPIELAIQDHVDRFTLAIDVLDRIPSLQVRGAHTGEALLNEQLDCRS